MSEKLISGSAQVEISPRKQCFLWGYPHEQRMSSGIHDPLFSSSLYLSKGGEQTLFIANDLIFVSKELCQRVRSEIHRETGIPEEAILISATHTHSGPTVVNYASNQLDPVVPQADEGYLDFVVRKMVTGACQSVWCAVEAELGLAVATVEGVGTNRHDPNGPSDEEVSVLLVQTHKSKEPISCMLIYSMHPTVLHEDSTLISGDFPGMTREYLQERILGKQCPVLYHNGFCGNLSPRYTARENTFQEAKRLGYILGEKVAKAIQGISFRANVSLGVDRCYINLKRRKFPSFEQAQIDLEGMRKHYEALKASDAPLAVVRTAECAFFGAEESLTLAKASSEGLIEAAFKSCLPAEIQLIQIDEWSFLSWPGEFFVEYALELKRKYPGLFPISMANGELQGYIVTPEAALKDGYEARNALFAPENGRSFIQVSERLLDRNRIQTHLEGTGL